MSSVMRLGYLGFGISDLDAWEVLLRDIVGLHTDRHGGDLLTARLDEHERRLIFKRSTRDDLRYAGWEVRDSGALNVLVTRLTGAGYAVVRGDEAGARERGVDEFVAFVDCAGNPVELFCAPAMAASPRRSNLLVGGMVTGEKGIGHYVAAQPDLEVAKALYCDILGLRVSDYICQRKRDGSELSAMFLHANTRHHSVAFVVGKLPQHIDHFYLQMREFEDLGRTYDRFKASPYAIRNSLGQHPNDHGVSFYACTPSPFALEIGWSDFDLVPEGWSTRTFDRTSVWGHRSRDLPRVSA